MSDPLQSVVEKRIRRTMKALEANKMTALYAATADEVAPLVESLLRPGALVATGGSMTLAETGVIALLQSGKYEYLDRTAVPPEEVPALSRRAFSADFYLTSSNAVTEQGELYNVDGNANRVAAMTYGPDKVICVVGCNKIVPDLAAAERRVKDIAAPANAERLSCPTPCAQTGKCENCHSPGRICCTTVIHAQQRIPGRITVILVGQPLGY